MPHDRAADVAGLVELMRRALNVMVSGVGPRPATPAFLYLYVDDADATYAAAIAAGATSLEAPAEMPYGDRRAMVQDRWGNVWQIAHRPRGVTA